MMKYEEKTIAFLGGSITEGTGASMESNCYRAIVSRWLAQRTKTPLRFINAGVGGTGSEYGCYRLRREVTAQAPELVFVEFAVNDLSLDPEKIRQNAEYMVRRLMEAGAAVVFINTFCMEMRPDYLQKRRPASVAVYRAVAERYGVPCIEAGEALWNALASGRAMAAELLPDGVHPSDRGHRLYAQEICRVLALGASRLPDASRPAVCPPSPALRLDMLPAAAQPLGEWKPCTGNLYSHARSWLEGDTPGQESAFLFTGSRIGLSWAVEADSGNLLWKVDDGPWAERPAWDSFALQFGRLNYTILAENLPQGPHRLTLRVSPRKETRATGHRIRIAAYLVEQQADTKEAYTHVPL